MTCGSTCTIFNLEFWMSSYITASFNLRATSWCFCSTRILHNTAHSKVLFPPTVHPPPQCLEFLARIIWFFSIAVQVLLYMPILFEQHLTQKLNNYPLRGIGNFIRDMFNVCLREVQGSNPISIISFLLK